MYATTFDFDFDDGECLVELVVIDGIIFCNEGDGRWYLAYMCGLGHGNSIAAHDLVGIISLSKYGTVYGSKCEHAPFGLRIILNTIHMIYRFKCEEHTFKQHKLDGRWDDIVARVRAELW